MEELVQRMMLSGYPIRYDFDESVPDEVLDDIRETMNGNKIRYIYHKNIFLFCSDDDFRIFKFLI